VKTRGARAVVFSTVLIDLKTQNIRSPRRFLPCRNPSGVGLWPAKKREAPSLSLAVPICDGLGLWQALGAKRIVLARGVSVPGGVQPALLPIFWLVVDGLPAPESPEILQTS